MNVRCSGGMAIGFACAVPALALCAESAPDAYPARPIRIVVP